MDLKDTVNVIKNVDKTLRNVVPIAEHVVDKVRRSTGIWGFEGMLTTPISSYCLVEMGDWQLRKHMFLSWAEKQTTLDMIGDSITGVSSKISDEVYKSYHTYNEGNNYIEDYQREAKYTTTREVDSVDKVTHKNNYGTNINVYPDDDNTGNDKFTDSQKWDYYEPNRNRNSIINKTKQLFNCHKVNTIISRFHTDPTNLDLYDGTDAKTEYGLSHGRNLLTYDAEHNGISYDRNGYDNPYCRVWTHHHQYSEQRARLMRPFSIEDENGEISYKTNSELHKWGGFDDMNDGSTKREFRTDVIDLNDTMTKLAIKSGNILNNPSIKTKPGFVNVDQKWGWKDSGADGWAKSVLDKETGLVNIAPKYLGGAEKNIHTKDCMFSIENLAWQGYDPYSFERALSWEQRGPFGGRIMWFPPYGLRFSEDSSVNWNEHSFIGRGENVFTYTNTSRSGTLEFMMVVDHPSILDYSTWYGTGIEGEEGLPKDTDVYRFFAGCDGGGVANGNGDSGANGNGGGGLASYVKPTPLTDEYLQKEIPPETKPITENQKPETPKEPEPEVPAPDEEIELTFYVFFPNNYSGYYDNNAVFPNSKVDPIAYLLCGKGTQWNCREDDVTKAEVLPISFEHLAEDGNFLGDGYEMGNSTGVSNKRQQETDKNYIIGTSPNWRYYKSSKYIPYKNKKWYYRIDGDYKVASGNEQYKNTFDQTLRTPNSYVDMKSYHLNCSVDDVKKEFPEESENERLYSLAEIACALKKDDAAGQNLIKGNSAGNVNEDRVKELIEMFDISEDSPYRITEIHGVGYSNAHGSNAVKEINVKRNEFLAEQRCKTVINWFFKNYGYSPLKRGSEVSVPSHAVDNKDLQDESGESAKRWRSAKMTIKVKKTSVKETKDMNQEPQQEEGQTQQPEEVYVRFTGFKEVEIDEATKTQLYVNTNETEFDKKERRWYYDEQTKEMKLWNAETKVQKTRRSSYNWKSEYGNDFNQNEEKNTLRYDQEYHFFKKLEATHKDVFDTLVQKLQYFDPAFHSMTPEGFMGRLNFLQQCTRQGDTISASDANGHTANNLAFGRPPFCILRLGDFYYQKIVIKNINITYDPLVLDLNNEGIGVVPLIANVTISFNFIGGGDLSGPVRRLQNAMSFNYYANGRLYDNRADRVERQLDKGKNWDTMGAMGNDKVDFDASYFHHVQMAK